MVSVAEMPEKITSPIIATQPEPMQKSETERSMIEIEQLDFKYGAHQVLHDVNLCIPARAVTAFIGPSGCGKTTLLRIILCQVQPTEGSVKLGQLTRFNYVDQARLQLNDERTVLEEISDGTEFVLFGDRPLSLRAYLKRFLFTDERIITQVKHLSGGERSRLLLARILKNGGNFLILDEPTAALAQREAMRQQVKASTPVQQRMHEAFGGHRNAWIGLIVDAAGRVDGGPQRRPDNKRTSIVEFSNPRLG
jgi:ATP-binding cassette subfamily F protein uup